MLRGLVALKFGAPPDTWRLYCSSFAVCAKTQFFQGLAYRCHEHPNLVPQKYEAVHDLLSVCMKSTVIE
jgi:hypothetical protein